MQEYQQLKTMVLQVQEDLAKALSELADEPDAEKIARRIVEHQNHDHHAGKSYQHHHANLALEHHEAPWM